MIFVLVPRVGAFEAVRPGIDLEHVIDDIGQRRFVDARAFVDAIAGVKAHAFGRNSL
jgi:hypothetical protein